MFETFNVPAMYLALQGALSLYSAGRLTGIVVDSGDGLTQAVPIYEGNKIPNAISKVDIGGLDLTRFLAKDLNNFRHNPNYYLDSFTNYKNISSADLSIVRNIKEKVCKVALDGKVAFQRFYST